MQIRRTEFFFKGGRGYRLTSFFILLTILSFTSKRVIKRAPTTIRDTRTIPVHWVQLGIAEHDLFSDVDSGNMF